MPILNLHIASGSDHAVDRDGLAAGLTRLAAEALGKDPSVTAVRIATVDAADFFVAARPMAETGAVVFSLEIRVTEGTNSADEMADFIKGAFDLVETRMGPIDPVSYVIVTEVPATAWGYGGRTQADRAAERISSDQPAAAHI